MLLRIGLPPIFLLKQFDRLRLDVRSVIQHFYNFHAANVSQIDLVSENGTEWVRLHLDGSKSSDNVPNVQHVCSVIQPIHRVAHTFRGNVPAVEDVFDVIFICVVIDRGDKGVVLRDVDVRNTRLEEGQLKVPHFLPINYLCEKVETQFIGHDFDVVDRHLRIPSPVYMNNQGAQPELLYGDVQHVRTVHAAADPQQAGEAFPFPLSFIFAIIASSLVFPRSSVCHFGLTFL